MKERGELYVTRGATLRYQELNPFARLRFETARRELTLLILAELDAGRRVAAAGCPDGELCTVLIRAPGGRELRALLRQDGPLLVVPALDLAEPVRMAEKALGAMHRSLLRRVVE